MSSGRTYLSRSRRRMAVACVVLTPALGAAALTACGDDDYTVRVKDAGLDTSTDGVAPGIDAGADATPVTDAGADASPVARGKYLVDHVAACGDCHTPRDVSGAPDMTKYLAGVECFVDVNGAATDGGCLNTPNLTNAPTGLLNFTGAQIKAMFQDGKRPSGANLAPVMPYFIYHSLTPADADAIVAYLRTVPGVTHPVPPSDPPFANVPQAATPIDPASVPPSDGTAAGEHGRYLATIACLDCHTPETTPPAPRPIDMSRPFVGGRGFAVGPSTIVSKNLTPDSTGLSGWTAGDIVRVLHQGVAKDDAGVCPPMPVGPMGAFGGLTDQDVRDIAGYVLSLPAVANVTPDNTCP